VHWTLGEQREDRGADVASPASPDAVSVAMASRSTEAWAGAEAAWRERWSEAAAAHPPRPFVCEFMCEFVWFMCVSFAHGGLPLW